MHGRGDVIGFRWRPDPARPKAMNCDAVVRTAAAVADLVADALASDQAAVTLGGDCTVELGTVAAHCAGVGRSVWLTLTWIPV